MCALNHTSNDFCLAKDFILRIFFDTTSEECFVQVFLCLLHFLVKLEIKEPHLIVRSGPPNTQVQN